MSLRRPSPSSGRRALVAAGLAAALVAVPGTAAADESNPLDEVTGYLAGLPPVPGLPAVPGEAELPAAPVAGGAPIAEGAPAAEEAPALPPVEVPPAIRDAFRQLADAAMLPENCVDGVADAIELILDGVVALPLELADALAELLELLGGSEGLPELPVGPLQDLVDQLLGGLTAAAAPAGAATDGGTTPTPAEQELPTLVQGLVALGEALQGCLPTAPAETPEPAPAPGTYEPPAPPPAAPPAAPVAQPAAYLGYAPTGADAAPADDASLPLTALGAGLVLAAAGAAGYGMRGRAVRPRD